MAKEVKKMEKMKKEFTDIEGGVDGDEVCACPSHQHRVYSLEPSRVYSSIPAPCMRMHAT